MKEREAGNVRLRKMYVEERRKGETSIRAGDPHAQANHQLAKSSTHCGPGRKYLSADIDQWAATWGIKLEHIQPGRPQQNACVERVNRAAQYEWRSLYRQDDLGRVERIATQWMQSCNHAHAQIPLVVMSPTQRLAIAAENFCFEDRSK